MRYLGIILLFYGMTACHAPSTDFPDGFWEQRDGSPCPKPPDMTPPTPRCAAAKGLPGDNVLCVDFSQVADPPTIVDWDFDKFDKGCWTTASGSLQIKSLSFATYSGTCGFLMPALSSSDFQKYSSFTVSVIHRVSISDAASQSIQVMLGADLPLARLMTQWTGKQTRQQSVIVVEKGDLPTGANTQYQPLFKLSAQTTAGGVYQGWSVESIAVNGNL